MKVFHKWGTRSDRQCMDGSQSRIRRKEQTTPTEKYISKMIHVIADHYWGN